MALRSAHRVLSKPFSSSLRQFISHRPSQRSISTTMANNIVPTYATDDKTRTEAIENSLQSLLQVNGGRWLVTTDSKGISRQMRFKTFRQASNFMTKMIPKIAEIRHHPSWTNTYNSVEMTWSTHVDKQTKMAGLSELDVQMAKTSDELAAECGEQQDTN